LSVNKIIFIFIVLWISLLTCAVCKSKGVILDKNNQPIQNVNITVAGNRTQSNENGFILLESINQKVAIVLPMFLLKKQLSF
jgi:hypothetical protein